MDLIMSIVNGWCRNHAAHNSFWKLKMEIQKMKIRINYIRNIWVSESMGRMHDPSQGKMMQISKWSRLE